jgi:putative transposase
VPNPRGPSDARPCAYEYRNSAQASGGIGDRIPERESAIAIARLSGKERNVAGEHFWARGYAVSTAGFELEQVRKYIREQEAADGATGQF